MATGKTTVVVVSAVFTVTALALHVFRTQSGGVILLYVSDAVRHGSPLGSDARGALNTSAVMPHDVHKERTPETTSEPTVALAQACSAGYHLEKHGFAAHHGDVCRGPDESFICPICCTSANGRPPWCVLAASADQPCRVSQCVHRARPMAGAVKPERYTIALVLRTWKKDARMGMKALSSLVKRVPLQRYAPSVLIMTDSDSGEVVSTQVDKAKTSGMFEPIEQSLVRLIVEEQFLADGNIQQKYSKLTSDLYTDARYILHIDSDVFYSRWDENCFFAGDRHQPLLTYAPWDALPPVVKQWKKGSEALLGLTNVEYEFSRLNQHVYPRELYSALRKRVEEVHGKSFRAVFKDTPLVGTGNNLQSAREKGFSKALLVSDFNLLGAVAHYLMPNIMFQDNLAEPAAPGVTRWSVCVRQCNARLFDEQCCIDWDNSIEEHMKLHGKTTKYNCASDFLPKAPAACAQRIRRNRRIACDSSHLGS